MEQSLASRSSDQSLQRLAAKSVCAADILKNAVTMAENWQKMHKKVNRYVQQVKLIVTWRKGCGALNMVGAASKTVGAVMVVAAPLHPKLGLAVKVGHKLWKLGAGVKILTAVGGMLRELWQTGCRNSVLDFLAATALLTQNLGVFGEVIRDLQTCVQPTCTSNTAQTAEQLVSLLKPFIPPGQLQYVIHVVGIVYNNRSYSPLFDLMLATSDLGGQSSNTVQLMREIESFRFTEFVQHGSSQFLVAIGGFVHVSRELLDFLDGFHKVTEQDCRFLHECFTKFSQESASVLRAASTLTNLAQVTGQHVSPAMSGLRHKCQGQHNVGMTTQLQEADTQNVGMTTQLQEADTHNVGMTTQLQEADTHNVGMTTQLQEADTHNVGMTTQLQEADTHNVGMTTQLQEADTQNVGITTQLQEADTQNVGDTQ